jgi:thiol-disulfide isomerase/thioredoxin/uncharacterized membrane protein YphA (DoxX/SURF4 family)
MQTFALVCRLALAAVLMVSAVAKLSDPTGTREAVTAFGLRARAGTLVALVLAPVELAVAVLLLPGATAPLGAALALALLAVFSTVVTVHLVRGSRPACNCFGRIGSSDISGRTLLRNAALAGLAVVGLLGEPVGPAVFVQEQPAGVVVGVLAAAGLMAAAVLLAELLGGRRATAEQDRTAAVELADALTGGGQAHGAAPAFELPDLRGGTTTLDSLRAAGLPLLLVFLTPGCGPCKRLRPAVVRWAEVYGRRLQVAIVSTASPEANRLAFPGGDVPVLLDDGTTRTAYAVAGTPGAVLVDADGLLRTPVAYGEPAVRRLLTAGLCRESAEPVAGPVAAEAPAASLTLRSRPAPRPMVTTRTVESEGRSETVAVDETSGASLSLDVIGGLVWSCLDGVSTLEEIVDDLAGVFGAPRDQVAVDVLELVRSLGRHGLLVGIAPEADAPTPEREPVSS